MPNYPPARWWADTRTLNKLRQSAILPPEIRSALQRLRDGAADRGVGAVDDVLRAGNRRGEVGAQKQHRVCDFIGRDIAAERDRRLVATSHNRRVDGFRCASSEWIIRVSTGPGQTALTRMPWRATSPAAVLVRPITACFEAT